MTDGTLSRSVDVLVEIHNMAPGSIGPCHLEKRLDIGRARLALLIYPKADSAHRSAEHFTLDELQAARVPRIGLFTDVKISIQSGHWRAQLRSQQSNLLGQCA